MHIIKYLTLITTAMLAMACTVQDSLWNYDADSPAMPGHYVVGRVMDADDKAIEHIKVTIDWGGRPETSLTTNWTASDGSFTAEIPDEVISETIEFKITLEDTDGQENGGLFETLSTKVIYKISPNSPNGFLVYRLNRATASENIPQS